MPERRVVGPTCIERIDAVVLRRDEEHIMCPFSGISNRGNEQGLREYRAIHFELSKSAELSGVHMKRLAVSFGTPDSKQSNL